MKRIDPKKLQGLEDQVTRTNVNKNYPIQICLDYGSKFCGIAYNTTGGVIFPLGVYATNNIKNILVQKIQEKKATKLIIGLPLSSDGNENELCNTIRAFSKSITEVPTELVNERYSSQMTMTPGDKNERIDDLAAAQILEFYLSQI